MERKEMTPAVENEVKNPVENNKNMNYNRETEYG